MQKVLGLDVGISSVGWALIEYDKNGNPSIIKNGVRIFTQAENPKDGKSLALPRREARGARRMLKRKRTRLKAIKELFVTHLDIPSENIFSQDNIYNCKKSRDVWQLRDKALKRALSKEEFARILTQIAKRRGYKSSKQDAQNAETQDADKKKELGIINSAIEKNKERLKGYQTIGQAIYQETNDNKTLKRRNTTRDYSNSISREMLKDEVLKIFQAQRGFGNTLASKEFEDEYIKIAFFQRPLKSFDGKVGICTFEDGEKRAPKRSYSAEEFTTLSKLVNTKLISDSGDERHFDVNELKKLMDLCRSQITVTHKKIREEIGLDKGWKFKNVKYYDSETGVVFDVDKVEEKEKFKNEFVGYHKLKNIITKNFSKIHWQNLQNDKILLNEIAKILSYHKDEDKAKSELEKLNFTALSESEKGKIIDILAKEVSFDKFNNLSIKAINKILPYMYEGKRYDEAVKMAYPNFKMGDKQKFLRALNEKENYEVTSPVVKRAIAQTRKVVNAIIRRYGTLDSIKIELARELKNSYKKRQEIEKNIKDYVKNKDKTIERFKECYDKEPTSKELQKFILREEQEGKCIYSQKAIEVSRLLEVGYVEIDHILPYSRSLDDTQPNKVLCLAKENQNKGNSTPYEYFNRIGRNWEQYIGFIGSLNNIKQNKKQRLLKTNFDENSAAEFRNRNLNDTAHIARFMKNFIEDTLEFNTSDKKRHVEVVNGNITTKLRHDWGVENKNRENHLHHAQDAALIAFSTQSVTQKLNTASAKDDNFKYASMENKSRKFKFEPPFEGFRDALESKVNEIFVSFAPRKKVTGAAHKETAYSPKTLIAKKKTDKPSKLAGGSVINNVKTKSGLFEHENMPRIDIFRHKTTKKYYVVPIYISDFIKDKLPNKAIVQGKKPDGFPKEWLEMDENYEFCFSFFKDELIGVETKKEKIFGYFVSADSATAAIAIKSHDNKANDIFTMNDKTAIKRSGIQNAVAIRKYQVDVLGNISEVKAEKRLGTIGAKGKKRGI